MRVIVPLAAALVAALVGVPPAGGSEPLQDANVTLLSLKVNGKGEALVSYRRSDGRPRNVLVWGALNARAPSETVPQVRFRWDYAGGWGKYRNGRYWRSFANRCRPYDGPPLAMLVAACKAPNGTYWTIQAWQRRLPLLGFDPWLPQHTNWELHLAHWSGPLPVLEVHPNWTYGGAWQGVFGRYSYLGSPIFGFGSNCEGRPEGPVRAQPVHRHAQLAVRTGLAARVRDPHASRDRHLLSQLRAAAAVRGLPEHGSPARRAGRAAPDHGRRPGGDAGDAGGARGAHERGSRPRRRARPDLRQRHGRRQDLRARAVSSEP